MWFQQDGCQRTMLAPFENISMKSFRKVDQTVWSNLWRAFTGLESIGLGASVFKGNRSGPNLQQLANNSWYHEGFVTAYSITETN
ncbi:hypothetical protein EVAR_17975_1 [Eumeta japonica]|uniref:Uncharacterized protein n=1 Tax=Eumeta variegata TaxID=151549 RepID=A0A4C1V0B8_EUMVA|nr:hypothetical protein EVAR_17975_1 [Eumeta japonica]